MDAKINDTRTFAFTGVIYVPCDLLDLRIDAQREASSVSLYHGQFRCDDSVLDLDRQMEQEDRGQGT